MKFIKTELAKKLETITGVDFTPVQGTSGSAGYDLRAAIAVPLTIRPDQVEKIPTGVKIWIDSEADATQDYGDAGASTVVGLLLPRSSTTGALLNNTVGVVDSDYQGEVFIKLRNITPEPITINTGESFAQLLFVPVFLPRLEEVTEFTTTTVRAEGGFGSTGK